MLNRRTFLSALSALPVVGPLFAKAEPAASAISDVDFLRPICAVKSGASIKGVEIVWWPAWQTTEDSQDA